MRILRVVSALLSVVGYLSAPAQVNHTTNVTLAQVLVNGASVPYGRLCAVAGDTYGNPVSFSSVGWGVVSANNPFCANVVNGAVSGGLSVPDANQTNRPTPITYTFLLQLTNSSFVGQSAAIVLFASVPGVSGPTFSLDGYTPSASAVAPAGSNLLGTGSGVPTSCTSPSIWIVPGTTPTILVCNNGTYQAGSTAAPTINFGTVAGTVAQGNDSRIVAAFKNQGTFSTTQSYNANDVVSVGGSLYYAPTAIAASSTMPPANGWLALGGATSSGGTVSINGVSCAVGSTCALTPATLGLATSAVSGTPMQGLDYWIPFSQSSAVDVTGNGHSGTIAGSGTSAAYVLGGIQPNGQTISIPNASGRPSFGLCAYFPGGDGPLNYGYLYSTTVSGQVGYNISTVYGPGTGHGANAYWPQSGSSAGSSASQSLNGYSGNHCVETIPGAAGQNIIVDGKEVAYALQANAPFPGVGASQLTSPMTVAGGNGLQTGLPITVYSVWGTPAASVDTVAQASARTAFEVMRLQALGVPFGLGSNLNTTATDSTCAFDGTSIDQGFEAANTPISGQLTLTFPCTLHDFSITGQPASDMDAAFQDRAGSVYHPRAQKNIAFIGGVTNDLTTYLETPAQALANLLSWNRKAHALGYKTIVSLALSRGGSTGGSTNDSLMQAANQLVLANADEFDWVANPAAWPQLGATGAYANTTYFNADGGSPTHPTVAGDVFYIATEQTAFNGVYPSAPRTITASATQLPADRVVIANCASACTYSLIDANTGNFNSRGRVTVQNIGTAAVTLAAVTGETVGAANTLAVAPGASVTILPYEANFTTAGAVWAIQSGLSTPVSTATATSPGTVQLAAGQSAAQLAKVASTGAYSDLSGTPSLGTAAAKNMVGTGTGGPATTPATPIGAGHAVVGALDGSGGLVDSNITPAQLGTAGQFAAMKPDASGYGPYNISGDCTASTTSPGTLTCLPNLQVASTSIAANTMVYPDPANVGKFTTAPVNDCGKGPVSAVVASGATFRVLDAIDTWQVNVDGPWTYRHLLIPSATTPGYLHDSGATDPTTISMEQRICGVALSTGSSAGMATVDPKFAGTRGLKVDTAGPKWSIISSKSNLAGSGTAAVNVAYSQNQVTFLNNYIVPAGINPTAIRLCYANYFSGNYSIANGENPNLNSLELFGSVLPNTTLNLSNTFQPTQNRTRVTWNGNQAYVLQPGGIQCSDPIYGNFSAGSSYYAMTGVNANSAPGPSPVTLSTTSTGGAFSNGTYTVAVTYVEPDGSNSTAVPANITLSAGTWTQTISLTTPAAAAGALGWRVYEGSTTLQCDTGFGVLPFYATGIGVGPQSASPDCVNGNASYVNIPTGLATVGGTGAGAANNGEGFKSGINVGYGFYVGAGQGGAYAPLYILGNVRPPASARPEIQSALGCTTTQWGAAAKASSIARLSISLRSGTSRPG